ncbi:hypothetical protein Rcae01_00081 [Novipirellula caenicola]|uniref:Uncharacterized protein n=1 Tax=Novipirellula caenicola TaxID=1536901 RepID=A0ABP9VHF6_9BACT
MIEPTWLSVVDGCPEAGSLARSTTGGWGWTVRGASETETGPHPDVALRARPTSPVLRSGEVACGEYVTFDSVASVCSCSKQTAHLLLASAAAASDLIEWGRLSLVDGRFGAGIFSKIHYGRVGLDGAGCE